MADFYGQIIQLKTFWTTWPIVTNSCSVRENRQAKYTSRIYNLPPIHLRSLRYTRPSLSLDMVKPIGVTIIQSHMPFLILAVIFHSEVLFVGFATLQLNYNIFLMCHSARHRAVGSVRWFRILQFCKQSLCKFRPTKLNNEGPVTKCHSIRVWMSFYDVDSISLGPCVWSRIAQYVIEWNRLTALLVAAEVHMLSNCSVRQSTLHCQKLQNNRSCCALMHIFQSVKPYY